jgi:16S rRNA (cytosine967-C5)-methyltransferase
VLRRLARERESPGRYPAFDDDPATFLSTWGSHPRWLVERWMRRWPAAVVRAIVERDNLRPAVTLAPLDVDPDEAVRVLERAGLAATPVGEGTGCVRLGDGVHPSDALVALPHAVVQDPAAHLVARYADVPTGTNVADLCAAPGGKVVAVADRPAYTLASDRSESRIRMVRENALRTGRRVGLAVADANRPPIASVDVVLLDVPCTGTGTLARNPDARWRLRPESVGEMAEVQARLLEAAAEVVGPGGLLVYSTCSLESEENEGQVRSFLGGRRDFRIDATDAVPSTYLRTDGTFVVTPAEHGFDGAFAARLRKVA